MRIMPSVHRCSMCSTGCDSSWRKSDGIVVVASGEFGDYEKLKTPLQDHIFASLSAFHLFFGLAMAS